MELDKDKVLIIDGNLFSQKMFHKFKNLESEIKISDLKKVSKKIAKLYVPELESIKPDKIIFSEERSKETGEKQKVAVRGKIGENLSSILSSYKADNLTIKIKTGVLYGVLNSLISIKEEFNPTKIVIAYDPIRNNEEILENKAKPEEFRGTISKDFFIYKEARKKASLDPKKTEEKKEFLKQLSLSYRFLYLLGIEQSTTSSFEADDILEYYSRDRFKDNEQIILTSDHDLFQLITEDVSLLRLEQKEKLLTYKSFKEKFLGLDPYKYVDVMSLSGCSSDGIPGLKGINYLGGEELIRNFGSLRELLLNFHKDEYRDKISTRHLNILNKERDNKFKIIKLTRKMVKLYGLSGKFKKDFSVVKLNSKKFKKAEDLFNLALLTLTIFKFNSFLKEREKTILKEIIKDNY